MTPKGLGSGGRKLWRVMTTAHDLDDGQMQLLEQLCRMRDRCDLLAPLAADGDMAAIRQERDSSMALARLLVALRLPDEATGKRPHQPKRMHGVQQPMSGSARNRIKAA